MLQSHTRAFESASPVRGVAHLFGRRAGRQRACDARRLCPTARTAPPLTWEDRRVSGSRYLLMLRGGEPPDPAAFVTTVPELVGRRDVHGRRRQAVPDRRRKRPGRRRWLEDLYERGINAIWMVVPAE
jgi:hypothetical protein